MGERGLKEQMGDGREGREGTEGNGGQCFPCPLRHPELFGPPSLILFPRSLPPATQNPSPTPTPPPRALPLHLETPCETPSNALRLTPTHTPSLRAPPPNSGTPHPRRPPFHVLPLPFCADPKQRSRHQGLFHCVGPEPSPPSHAHTSPSHPPRSCPTKNPAPA